MVLLRVSVLWPYLEDERAVPPLDECALGKPPRASPLHMHGAPYTRALSEICTV